MFRLFKKRISAEDLGTYLGRLAIRDGGSARSGTNAVLDEFIRQEEIQMLDVELEQMYLSTALYEWAIALELTGERVRRAIGALHCQVRFHVLAAPPCMRQWSEARYEQRIREYRSVMGPGGDPSVAADVFAAALFGEGNFFVKAAAIAWSLQVSSAIREEISEYRVE